MENPFRLSSDTMFLRTEEDEQQEPRRIVFLSVEGNKTEAQYLRYVEKYRNKLGIKKDVHIHSLGRARRDNLCAPNNVLELLEEYLELREAARLPERLRSAIPSEYSDEFIEEYVKGNADKDSGKVEEFRKLLDTVGIDLEYNFFLKEYRGKSDVFGIVIDRDYKSHTVAQMKNIVNQCKEKGYKCFVTTPLFEFWLLMHLVDIKNTFESELQSFLINNPESEQHTFTSKRVSEIAGHAKSIRETTFVNYYLPKIDYAINQARSSFTTDLDELVGNDDTDEAKRGKLGTNLSELFELLRNV